MHRPFAGTLKSLPLIVTGLCLLVLAGCGSPSSAATNTGTNATATACAQATRPAASLKTAAGTLKSINGQTLVITNRQGSDITVTYSDKTRFTQAGIVSASNLQEGTSVRVAVTNTNGSYSATSVQVLTTANGTNGTGFPGGNGTPGAGRRGNNVCVRQGQGGNLGNGNGNGTRGFRGLIGKISQVNGNTLVITDTAGTDYTVTLTSQTQIVETQSTTSAALKVGQALTAVGRADSQGVISANTIAILTGLPGSTTSGN